MKTLFGVLIASLALLTLPELAAAQSRPSASPRTYGVSLMGGLGGSIDEDDAGVDNAVFQLGASVMTEGTVRVGIRLGQFQFASEDTLGDLLDPGLTYLTAAGEYTFGETTYQSGLFVGIGLYDLDGVSRLTGDDLSSTEIGFTAGATGEFDVSGRLSFIAELTGHVLPGGEAQFFAAGLVGFRYYVK